MNTAAVVVDWSARSVEHVEVGLDDDRLVELVLSAGVAGIDAPLGWPELFVEEVARWHRGGRWRSPYASRSGELRLRLTDHVAHAHVGRFPLSVSTDRIGTVAMRCAWLLGALEDRGAAIDRAGLVGSVVETWPLAARRVWGDDRAWGLGVGDEDAALLESSAHAADAMLCAALARAARLGLTVSPGAAELEVARREGWIHIPLADTAERL